MSVLYIMMFATISFANEPEAEEPDCPSQDPDGDLRPCPIDVPDPPPSKPAPLPPIVVGTPSSNQVLNIADDPVESALGDIIDDCLHLAVDDGIFWFDVSIHNVNGEGLMWTGEVDPATYGQNGQFVTCVKDDLEALRFQPPTTGEAVFWTLPFGLYREQN